MPRAAKRTLAESDPNAQLSAPKSKGRKSSKSQSQLQSQPQNQKGSQSEAPSPASAPAQHQNQSDQNGSPPIVPAQNRSDSQNPDAANSSIFIPPCKTDSELVAYLRDKKVEAELDLRYNTGSKDAATIEESRAKLRVINGVIKAVESAGRSEETSGEPATTETTTSTSVTAEGTTGAKFITTCRPGWDIRAELWYEGGDSDQDDEDEDFDEEEGENDQNRNLNSTCGTETCMCKKPAEEHPNWVWIISEDGLKVFGDLQEQAKKRDQDYHDMYIYNDFSAYGTQEVVENWVC
jgi:hypothetical protein